MVTSHNYQKILLIAAFLFGLAFIGVIIVECAWRARHKWFWYDEAHEVLISSNTPYLTLITKGSIDQCSPAPLYYILQKVLVTHIPLSGENLLIFYRTISLVSCLLCLALLLFTITKYLSPILGIVILILMNNQPILHQFAAENRPYLLWMLLFTLNLILFSILAMKPWAQITSIQKIGLASASLALAAVSGAGMIQVAGFCLFFFLFANDFQIFNFWKARHFKFIAILFLASTLLGLNYALSSCLHYDGKMWDLLRTKNWNLIVKVFALFWPLHRTILTYVLNFFLLVGLLSPLFLFRERKKHNARKKFALSLSMAAGLQIFCTVIIGILIARAHYYFIPRVFIFLIVLRACLVVSGAYLTSDWLYRTFLEKRLSTFKKALLEVSLMILILLGALRSTVQTWENLTLWVADSSLKWPQIRDFTCPEWTGPIAVVQKPSDFPDLRLNFVTRLAEELRECHWTPHEGPPLYYLPKLSYSEPFYEYETKQELSNRDAVKISIIGRPLIDDKNE